MSGGPAKFQLWNASQRAVLAVFVLVLAIALLVRLHFNRQYISNPQPTEGARAGELADRIDPNTADLETLSVIPELGEKRAREIIAYRKEFFAQGRGKVAFASPQDLLKVRGIGVSMIENISPYLTFPATQPATRP